MASERERPDLSAQARQALYRWIPGLYKLQRDIRLYGLIGRTAKEDAARLEELRGRDGHAYEGAGHPLVSVTIPTYNRGAIVSERTLPSVLEQTYPNFEVVVVGDCCTDDTEDRIAALSDPRICFVNLRERASYPEDPIRRHKIAGYVPKRTALGMARGDWIAHLDDDDTFTPDHIEVLLRHAQANDLELVYAKQLRETDPDEWVVVGRPPFPDGRPPYGRACVPHRTVMHRRYLNFFEPSMEALTRFNIGGDMLVWERMGRAGVRAGFLDRIVARKYRGAPRAHDPDAADPVSMS